MDRFEKEAAKKCRGRSKRFYVGAIVHLPGECDVWSEISADYRKYTDFRGNHTPFCQAKKDMGGGSTCFFSVNENTGHVLCGGAEADWIMEKLIPGYSSGFMYDFYAKDRWQRIMNPRKLEYIIPWCKRKHEEGITVRLRNLRTGEVIPGDVL